MIATFYQQTLHYAVRQKCAATISYITLYTARLVDMHVVHTFPRQDDHLTTNGASTARRCQLCRLLNAMLIYISFMR